MNVIPFLEITLTWCAVTCDLLASRVFDRAEAILAAILERLRGE
jgi:hypothetical protein